MARSGVILFGLALLSPGCGKGDKPATNQSTTLNGKWESTFHDGKGVAKFEFKDDGTYETTVTVKSSVGRVLGHDVGTWTYSNNHLQMKPSSSVAQFYKGDVLEKEIPGPTRPIDAKITWFGFDTIIVKTTVDDSILERVVN